MVADGDFPINVIWVAGVLFDCYRLARHKTARANETNGRILGLG